MVVVMLHQSLAQNKGWVLFGCRTVGKPSPTIYHHLTDNQIEPIANAAIRATFPLTATIQSHLVNLNTAVKLPNGTTHTETAMAVRGLTR